LFSKKPLSGLISDFGDSPEHLAVVNDDIEALDIALAAADGDCNVKHLRFAHTPLTLAILFHRTRIVEHLVKRVGVDVNYNVPNGRSPIEVAADNGNAESTRILLEAGADVEPNANALCFIAAENSDVGVLRLLLAAMPMAEFERDWQLAVPFAAGNPNHQSLAALIEAGVSVWTPSNSGLELPLHVAARNPNVAVVRLLLDAGVDVNVLDEAGENVLFDACGNHNIEVLDALLAAGANWRDHGLRRTILHAAASNENEAIVKRVIQRGARDFVGATALMYAAKRSTAAVVSILLEAGADVRATDTRPATVCQFACENTKNAGIVRVLIAAGAAITDDVLAAAITNSNIEVLQTLIDSGMNVAHAINANPQFLFNDSYVSLSRELLEFLIRHGLDFRMVWKGQTLCHKACERGWTGWADVLFAHGADLAAKDSAGVMPIQIAEMYGDIVLLAAGVHVPRTLQVADYLRLKDYQHWLLAALGHSQIRADSVSGRQLAWACHQIAQNQFELLRLRAFQVCVGLEGRHLPALVTCEILSNVFAPLESLVAFHRVWSIATAIKHFPGHFQ
jgi:ankyrin repeat protein